MTDEEKNPHAVALASLGASKGGQMRAEKLSSERKREIAQKAALARWGTKPAIATHEGIIKIGKAEIGCAVLENGQRVLTQSDFMRALGRARQAKGRAYYDADVNMPAFLTAKNLKPFIPGDLAKTSSQVEFKTVRGLLAYGYPAELLPKVCDVFLDAEDGGVLAHNQRHIASAARMLMRGLAHVGILALVDEATGYQEVRDRRALQEILDRYLLREFAAWAKRFPDEFYREIFRLKGWAWRGMKINRPQVVAHYTKDVVYQRLAPGILRELEVRNPKIETGRRLAKHHQFLTEEVGHPALAQHLHAVMGLMRASRSWDSFMRLLDAAFPRRGDTLKMAFMTDPPPSKGLAQEEPRSA